MKDYPQKTIWVRCSKCHEDFDEQDVEFLNIEEDGMMGWDILTFKYPRCGETRKSMRRG